MASTEEQTWLKERMQMVREWGKDRPAIIQSLAEEFPLLLVVRFGCQKDGIDGRAYVIGYTENGYLTLSPVNPCEDYDASIAARFHVDPDDLRQSKCSGHQDQEGEH